MKAKSRRRLLISSIAMLLVAMLALGTATFAWFTSSTTATASGINVQTTQASELQISKSDLNWGTSVNYNMTTAAVYQPASSEDGTHWFTAEAGARDNYEKKTGTNFNSINASDKSGYYFEETLNVKNAGTAAIDQISISWQWTETGTTGKNYLRVALVPITISGTVNTAALEAAKPADAATFRAGVFAADNTSYYPVAADGSAASATAIAPKNTYSVTVPKLTGGSAAYYKLYVWFEGQDVDCQDVYAGNTMPSISFQVTGTTTQS